MKTISLIHVILVGGFLLYIGMYREKSGIPNEVLFLLGLFVIFYHGYKWFRHGSGWIGLLHVLFVGPLLLLVSLPNCPRYYYEIVLMTAFATIGYHGYYLIL